MNIEISTLQVATANFLLISYKNEIDNTVPKCKSIPVNVNIESQLRVSTKMGHFRCFPINGTDLRLVRRIGNCTLKSKHT